MSNLDEKVKFLDELQRGLLSIRPVRESVVLNRLLSTLIGHTRNLLKEVEELKINSHSEHTLSMIKTGD